MKLNRDLLKNALDNLGYEYEFDSKTPGITTKHSVISWDDIATIDVVHSSCVDKNNIKTAKLNNLTFTNSFKNPNNNYKKTFYKHLNYQDGTLSNDTGRLVA